MQTLAPSLDRLGAALRALRQAHAHDESEDAVALGAKCLRALVAEFSSEGLAQEDLQPLLDLARHLTQPKNQARAQVQGQATSAASNRRKLRPPRDEFLARISAVIDLLIKAGYEDEEAAQIAMRRLIAAGVPPPKKGADARGWKRLLEWRAHLNHGLVSDEAKEEYRNFTRRLETIPAHDRLTRVLDEQLWERRQG